MTVNMHKPSWQSVLLGFLVLLVSQEPAAGQEPREASQPPAIQPASVKNLAARVRDSIVVVTFAGREGNQQGLGTGFVIAKDGLIATNLHVIGEARPIEVRTAAGKSLPVTAVHASDRTL